MAPLGTSMSISHDIFQLRFFYLQTDLTCIVFRRSIIVFCSMLNILLPRQPGVDVHRIQYRNKHQPQNGQFQSLLPKKTTNVKKRRMPSTKNWIRVPNAIEIRQSRSFVLCLLFDAWNISQHYVTCKSAQK